MTPEYAQAGDACLVSMRSVETKLAAFYKELQSMKISPPSPHTSDDLLALVDAATYARGYSERAAYIHAESLYLKAVSDAMFKRFKGLYQDRYDEVVKDYAKLHGDLSWEERANVYRTRMLDEGVLLRKVEVALAVAVGYVDPINVLCQAIYFSRAGIQTIVDTYKVMVSASFDAQRGN